MHIKRVSVAHAYANLFMQEKCTITEMSLTIWQVLLIRMRDDPEGAWFAEGRSVLGRFRKLCYNLVCNMSTIAVFEIKRNRWSPKLKAGGPGSSPGKNFKFKVAKPPEI